MSAPAAAALFDLTGRTALVTGASRGLGRRFAQVLARAGAAVGVAARDRAELDALCAALEAEGGRAAGAALDVTDAASIEPALDALEAVLGPIDVVVNNAGITVSKPFLEQATEDWDRVLGTNLRGAFLVAQGAARRMAPRGRGGSIIHIASVLGLEVVGSLAPYIASKGGLVQLTRAMALELARFGIRVNAIAPGYFETGMNREFFQSAAGERLRARIPQRRLGREGELDGALLLLASDASSYMTGSVLRVDGGFGLG
jgi:NAD(P)-dependent dehydrogenase (short-subunit alcohol dehydrogenase family)